MSGIHKIDGHRLVGPRAGEALERMPSPLRAADIAALEELTEAAGQMGRADLIHRMDSQRRALEQLTLSVAMYPSPLSTSELGEHRRDVKTLLKSLARQNFFSIDLVVPTRAIVTGALNMARLNFFRMLNHVADQLILDGANIGETHLAVLEDGVADSIGLRAAEEILRAIICRDGASNVVRERAALLILHLWHDFNSEATRDLLPMLFHTWQARRRVKPVMGTLLGASELFSLLANGCDTRFIDFLNREDVTTEEVAAFQEFLFGMSSEELEELRALKGSGLVSVDELRGSMEGTPMDSVSMGLLVAGDRAERLYLYFMKRHIHAMNRALKNLPGPKQTAEQYMLENLLMAQWELFNPEE